MRSKYHAKKVYVNGEMYDSQHEYERWLQLCLLQRAGKISDLQRQVTYELIPTQREPDTIGPRGGVKPGKFLEHGVTYTADFVYVQDGQTVVEDAKGYRTDDYVIRRKLMLWIHGIRIKEV